MSNIIPGKQKHFTLENRTFIEDSLNQGFTFKEIAILLCKNPSMISKEVKAHRIYDDFIQLELNSFSEMDTVYSSRESDRVLLTFFLTKEKLFLALLLNHRTPGAVCMESGLACA